MNEMRRRFLAAGATGAAAIVCGVDILGCSSGPAALVQPPTGPNPTPLPPTCGDLTEPNIEGPFFLPGSPERANLRVPGLPGVPVRLVGRVLAEDCSPLPASLLDFWQANDDGAYDDDGFDLRGHQFTDEDGAFRLETILPGHYLNGDTFRPAHIHVKAGGQGSLVLTTQLYFEGDPYNEGDPFIHPSLVITLKDAPDGVKEGTFDFVLTRA